jgi:hypothetical protein
MTPSEPQETPELDPSRAPLLRSTVLAWSVSTALVVIGGLLAAAWLWQLIRTQQQLSAGGVPSLAGGASSSPAPSLIDRVDALSETVTGLGYAGIVVGLGIGLRLVGDMVAARLGRLTSTAPEPTIGPDTP